jgi:hypothetical protein
MQPLHYRTVRDLGGSRSGIAKLEINLYFNARDELKSSIA